MSFKSLSCAFLGSFLALAVLQGTGLAQAPNPKLKSPTLVSAFYRQVTSPIVRNAVNNQTGTLVFLFWNGPSAETDTVCKLDTTLTCNINVDSCEVAPEICQQAGFNCRIDSIIGCQPVWTGYRVRRTVEGISTGRLQVIGQMKSRDVVVPICLDRQEPCNLQDFVFTGTGVFFKGFRNNRLPDGSYLFDYPPGNPRDADSTARVFVDLASIVGFEHEYAVTSIDTLTTVNADIAESPIDSTEIVRLTPATPPASNLENVVVVPNPYKGSAEWDPGPNDRRMRFMNVPPGSTIRIYTAAGELLRELTQDPGGSPGGQTGEVPWDLKNDAGRVVVSGIYIYTVHPTDGRTPKKGHFVIIK
ncbi:MAG TPA: hypothetical protein VFP58_07120 [Candidatus Eisenbacteria bacterium]|nr:hypothetical protein [Candidatus Eisenbacteria bacterium]